MTKKLAYIYRLALAICCSLCFAFITAFPAEASPDDKTSVTQPNSSIAVLPTGLGFDITGDFMLVSGTAHNYQVDILKFPGLFYTHGTLSHQKNAAAFMPPKHQLQNSDRAYRDNDGRLNRINIGVDAVRGVVRLIRN